jgi:F0F1-type ATP synthase delta subunit
VVRKTVTNHSVTKTRTPTLPPSVYGMAEIRRLRKELDHIEDKILQLRLREESEDKMPKLSRFMQQTVEINKLNLAKAEDSHLLKVFLKLVEEKAPLLHFSFSADPSTKFMEDLVVWLRKEINPHVLVTIGLQPNIGAGCIVHTTNKYFDLSLRQTFADNRPDLLKKLGLPSNELSNA